MDEISDAQELELRFIAFAVFVEEATASLKVLQDKISEVESIFRRATEGDNS